MGLIVVRETPAQAQALAVPGAVQTDMLEAAALVPTTPRRIDDPTTVARLTRPHRRPRGPRPRRPRRSRADPRAAARSRCATRATCGPGPPPPTSRSSCGPSPSSRATPRRSSPRRRRPRRSAATAAAARGAPRAPRERDPGEEADGEPALGPRGAQDPHRRLQRAHRPLRRDGPLAGPARAHRGRPRVPPRRVLLPRVARGLGRGVARPRAVAARWTPRSTSSPPTRPTCASPAAASSARPRSWASSAARASRSSTWSCGPGRPPSSWAGPRATCVPWTCRCRGGTAAGGAAGPLPRRSRR